VSNNVQRALLWVSLIVAIFALVTLVAAPSARAQNTSVQLEVPSGPIGADDAPFTVQVLVEDVTNLGAFEFDLRYEPSVVGLTNVEMGPFLGSSGRRVQCLDPQMAAGSVHFVCVTIGATPAGPDGSGVIATLTFDPAADGSSFLRFGDTVLAGPDGQPIPATTVDASVTVGSTLPPRTPPATGTPAAATPTAPTTPPATTATRTVVAPRPTSTESPPATTKAEDGDTNWALWGSVIGGIAALAVVGAGVAWWSRARGLP
jgi:general secretion pathway protein D